MGRDGQKQHADIHRKVRLREQLLGEGLTNVADGAVYVPFCGDGDLTGEVGYFVRDVWAADIDADRLATFRERFPEATVVEGDCDHWPFDPDEHGDPPTFAIADLDAYVYPYHAHRALFDNADTADRIAVFYTDGQRQTAKRNGIWHDPDGTRHETDDITERRTVYNAYWTRVILPWAHTEADRYGYHIADTVKYLRRDMIYWGAIYDRQPATHPDHSPQDAHTPTSDDPPTNPTHDDRQAVTDALTEAAISGNVRAMIEWLDRNEPTSDPKKRRTPHGPPTYGLHGRPVYDDVKDHPRCTADAKSKIASGATPHSPEARCGNRPIDGHWVCRNHGGSADQVVRQAKLNLLDGVSPAISALVRPLQELERRAGLDLMYEGYLTDETLELARSLRKQSNDVLDRMGYPRRTEIDLAGAQRRVLERLASLDDEDADTDDE